MILIPWKSIIIYCSLRRGFQKTFDRTFLILASLGLAALLVLVISLALLWLFRLGPYAWLYQIIIAWHWIIGLLLIPLFLFHLWRRWPNPRPAELLSRRSFLKLAAVAGAGLVVSKLTDWAANSLASAGVQRRFTGSREMGSFSGYAFPLTGEAARAIDLASWRLYITGAVQPRSNILMAKFCNASNT